MQAGMGCRDFAGSGADNQPERHSRLLRRVDGECGEGDALARLAIGWRCASAGSGYFVVDNGTARQRSSLAKMKLSTSGRHASWRIKPLS